MRYFRLLGVALVAVCAVCAMMVASAFALPTILPTTITSWKGASIGETELLKANGENVRCAGATLSGTVEANGHLGLYTTNFTGCKIKTPIEAKCTGESGPGTDSEGVILTAGSWHLVYDTLSTSLASAGLAILFLTGKVNFKCTTLAKIEVPLGGMVLCLVLNPTALTKIFETHCSKAAVGNRPLETKYYNEAGTFVSIVALLSNLNGGTFEENTQIGLGTLVYPEAALLMV